MIENIVYKKEKLALIVRSKYRNKKGITFFTHKNLTQQFGYMKHKKKHIIKPHVHKKRLTKVYYTTEVIIILKGILRVDFYTQFQKYLFSKILKSKDIIMLISGGHGFKVLKDVEMLEIKQGPYSLIKDKIKFENFNDNNIKFRK